MFEILFILIVFFCILLLAYAVTRLIAKRAAVRMKSRHIEIIDSLGVGADSQLLLIKVGDEYFLAAKSQKQLSNLTKLSFSADDSQTADIHATGFAESFFTVLEGKLSRARIKRRITDSDVINTETTENAPERPLPADAQNDQ